MNSQIASFRYVIVGAGSAGCMLARLLAEDQDGHIAVIEAGSRQPHVHSVVPNFYPRTFGSSRDWNFSTTPQRHLAGRSIAWPRGRGLGGSAAINALIYLQAAEADLRRWGWDEDPQVLERLQQLIPIAPLATPHPWTSIFLDAARSSGLQFVNHWSRAAEATCGLLSLTQRRGRRFHAGQLIYNHDTSRELWPNIHLIDSAEVEDLEIVDDRVVGVNLRDAHGQPATVLAEDEVILSAGTIGSPLLLQKSGIGDPRHLHRLQHKCLHELPAVGRYLQDHLVYPVVFRTRSTLGLPRRHSPAARQAYRRAGTGPLASNIAEAAALSSAGQGTATYPAMPELQIHFTPTHYLKYPSLPTPDHFLTLAVTDLHPGSRGVIGYERQGSRWEPHIAPNYLEDPNDLDRLLMGIRWARDLASRKPLSELIDQEALPGAKRVDSAGLTKSIRMFARSIYHPIGTCRMDSPQIASSNAAVDTRTWGTVVDSQYRVHGLRGLRIVDASILPDLPSANTNAITLLLAARAAKMIVAAPK